MVKFLFLFIVLFPSSDIKNNIRRIIIKEYPGGTILPTKKSNEVLYADLYDGRYIKAHVHDYRGKMYLQCYSSDSILLEEGNYNNSLTMLKKQVTGLASGESENRVLIIEYYEPLRNGRWLFYDSLTGKLKDSLFYKNGILIGK